MGAKNRLHAGVQIGIYLEYAISISQKRASVKTFFEKNYSFCRILRVQPEKSGAKAPKSLPNGIADGLSQIISGRVASSFSRD